MYPLAILFGFGFDTASEVALLGLTAAASMGDLPTRVSTAVRSGTIPAFKKRGPPCNAYSF